MKPSTSPLLHLTFFCAIAHALPSDPLNAANTLTTRQAPYQPCTSPIYSNAYCCEPNVIGPSVLQCQNPPDTPISQQHYAAMCASIGWEAMCCTETILGDWILCQKPDGMSASPTMSKAATYQIA